MNGENARSCLTCGTAIKGRADKKFCSDYCRSVCHNNNKPEIREYVRRVNYILGKNRRILSQLVEEGKKEVPREVLKVRGFDFSYVTSVQDSPYGPRYYCYEVGFSPAEDQSRIILVEPSLI